MKKKVFRERRNKLTEQIKEEKKNTKKKTTKKGDK